MLLDSSKLVSDKFGVVQLDFEPDLWIKAESLVEPSNTSSICTSSICIILAT